MMNEITDVRICEKRERFYETCAKKSRQTPNVCMFPYENLPQRQAQAVITIKESCSMEHQQDTAGSQRIYYKIIQEPNRPHVILLEPAMIPYIFHFSEKTLSFCRINPKLAPTYPLSQQLFATLKNRIIAKRRSSRTGRAPTRMKYEEKVKFVMRSLEYRIADIQKRPPRKIIKFNIEEQREFFQREDVIQHFQEQMPIIIEAKTKANDVKIRKFEQVIIGVMIEAKKDIEFGRKQLEDNIKQSQLPWSIEMLQDIQIFAQSIYQQFVTNHAENKLSKLVLGDEVQADQKEQKDEIVQNYSPFDSKQNVQKDE